MNNPKCIRANSWPRMAVILGAVSNDRRPVCQTVSAETANVLVIVTIPGPVS
jgi:hypothetical protein